MSIYEHLTQKTPIDKGWSGDRKYRAGDGFGGRYLLRVSPPDQYDKKLGQFRRMEAAAALEIPMCRPLEFGKCEEGIYSIQSWIDGQDAEAVIPSLPPQAQYGYGLEAGRILRKLHTLPAPADTEPWEVRVNRKIDRKIAMYDSCALKYQGGEAFLEYITRSRHLLSGRPQTYQHGDYHIGNMMVDNRGTLTILDFEKVDWGDPWEEFNRIVWSAQSAPDFASGMVDSYFGGSIPQEFWDLLALYICSNTLGSLPWAIPFGEKEVATMRRQAGEVLAWYDGIRTTVPAWYQRR